MKSVHEILHERLLRSIGLAKLEPWWKEFIPKATLVTLADIDKAVKRKWCPRFFKLMRNRLAMGYLRYEVTNIGKVKKKYDFIGAIRTKLDLYEQTGNTECLVDIGNYSMLEFKTPKHPNAHFEAGDDIGHAEEKK